MKYDLKKIMVRFDNWDERMIISEKFKEAGFKLYECAGGMIDYGWFYYADNDHEARGSMDLVSGKTVISFEEFTKISPKDYLEDGVIVQYRNGETRLYINKVLLGVNAWCDCENLDDNLLNTELSELDVVKIYKPKNHKSSLNGLLTRAPFRYNLVLDVEEYREELKKKDKKQQLLDQIAELEKAVKELD